MSRTDQWVGLTDKANAYIHFIKEKYKGRLISEKILLVGKDISLCGDEFYGTQLTFQELDDNSPNSHYIIREKIQMTPWSSGPMYFTCLSYACVKRLDKSEVQLHNDMYQWINGDYSLDFYIYYQNLDCKSGGIQKEYDRAQGIVYI